MRTLPLAAAALLVPTFASAQVWRTLEVSRQFRDTSDLHVVVQYGAGKFNLRPATEPVLYSMRLRYDETNMTPLHTYDSGAGTLKLGVTNMNRDWTHRGSDDEASLRLALAPTVPMELDLQLGATQATMDLGGLTLRGLDIETGAADETVDFSTPNRTTLADLSIHVGAANFAATNLANARTTSMRVSGGVGAVTLDFGGQWTSDIDANVQVALGKVTVRVPDNVGVRLDLDRIIASFDHDGLTKRDGAYVSDNWDTAQYHLRLHVETTLGAISVRRFTPGHS